jgi:hypothetical protein
MATLERRRAGRMAAPEAGDGWAAHRRRISVGTRTAASTAVGWRPVGGDGEDEQRPVGGDEEDERRRRLALGVVDDSGGAVHRVRAAQNLGGGRGRHEGGVAGARDFGRRWLRTGGWRPVLGEMARRLGEVLREGGVR